MITLGHEIHELIEKIKIDLKENGSLSEENFENLFLISLFEEE